jgi:hypothetical protein
MIDE